MHAAGVELLRHDRGLRRGRPSASAWSPQRRAGAAVGVIDNRNAGREEVAVGDLFEGGPNGQDVPSNLAFTTGMTLSARYWIRSDPDSIDSPGYCAQ